ncbi:MAG: hypothetical protein RRY11_12835 [Terrisporobacter sp.]
MESYGLKEEQLDEAGSLWTPEQIKNKTIPAMFEGMAELFHKLKPIKNGTFIYIGDHSEDIVFGKNAQLALKEENINVICITVDYLNLNVNTYKKWSKQPDYFVQTVSELDNLLN